MSMRNVAVVIGLVVTFFPFGLLAVLPSQDG